MLVNSDKQVMHYIPLKCGGPEASTDQIWAEFDAETVHVTCDQVIPCLCQVIKEKGVYIE